MLEIGQKLYKYSRPYLLEYKVVGVRIYQAGQLYELECISCTHGEHCRVLVGGKLDKLSFIEMADNNNEEEEYWHTTKSSRDGYFKISLEEAKIDQQRSILVGFGEEIKRLEEQLKQTKDKKKLAEALIASMKFA